MKFTLDNNCLIAVANDEPAAAAVKALAQAHAAEKAEVAMLGISASERQTGGRYLQNIGEFQSKLVSIGLGHLTVYKPTGIWGMTFWDWCVSASPESMSLERKIHDSMFSPSEFEWRTVASAAGEAVESQNGPAYRRWRNRRCDVQGMLAHILNGGDVFVSSDNHFLGNSRSLIALGAGQVLQPSAAAALI